MSCKYCHDTKKITLFTSVVDCTECAPEEKLLNKDEKFYLYYDQHDGDQRLYVGEPEPVKKCSHLVCLFCHNNKEYLLLLASIICELPRFGYKQDIVYMGHFNRNYVFDPFDLYYSKEDDKILVVYYNCVNEYSIICDTLRQEIYDIYQIFKNWGKI